MPSRRDRGAEGVESLRYIAGFGRSGKARQAALFELEAQASSMHVQKGLPKSMLRVERLEIRVFETCSSRGFRVSRIRGCGRNAGQTCFLQLNPATPRLFAFRTCILKMQVFVTGEPAHLRMFAGKDCCKRVMTARVFDSCRLCVGPLSGTVV